MEQPRFGGVALSPLSIQDGEGMSPGSVTNTMEPDQVQTLHLPRVTQDQHTSVCEAARDDDVQNVMEVLYQLGICTRLERHKLKHERQSTCGAKLLDNEVYCKNLLLKDKKGQAYLIVCEENDTADLNVVKYHLNAQGNLHFASKDSLWKLLRVNPGAVSPLALIHCSDVRVFIDDSLVNRIDPNTTRLYFHPLRADLQVSLTLLQLKKFLHHCGVNVEILPSLSSYSACRRYTPMKYSNHWNLKAYQERKSQNKYKESRKGQTQEKKNETASWQQTTQPRDNIGHVENMFPKHTDLDQHGVTVETVSRKGNACAFDDTVLPCKCVYLKDKRNNYFFFICHENQKVDFSNLKTKLKPKKKIEPLTDEELWSLLHLQSTQEHPFVLADLKQPMFLVAIADNLDSNHKTVLTFPHPSDCSLCLKITLNNLETFIDSTSHDLITIQVKGKIDELQTVSGSFVHQPSATAQLHSPKQNFEDTEHTHPSGPGNEQHFWSLSEEKADPVYSSTGHRNNLFFRLTAPLRTWITRCIRSLLGVMDRYLPYRLSEMLHRWSLWNRMLTSENGGDVIEGRVDQNEDNTHRLEYKEKEKMAKIAKLEQLIEKSGLQASLTRTGPLARFLKDDAERCRTYLIEDERKRLYFLFCTEDDEPSYQNIRRLRTVFRSRGALKLASDTTISQHLSWVEGSDTISWTQEDLCPMVMMDMDLQRLGRIRAGMTGALYSFPDTMLCFDLPPLGVTLRMTCGDLETLIEELGFRVVYLP